ncbi:MAG: long-chain-fatty-acid--CoA ligase [Proteobacteria bacterium]|nr:long-chain-fatty-acid--CoA ligase [Pseudomonadota bacterium]
MVLGDLASRNTRKFPEKVAVIFEDQRLTFKAFNEKANQLANALIATGLQQGDRVAILNHNTLRYALSFFGIWKAGGIAVPLNNLFKARELEFLINDSGAKIILLGDNYVELAESMRPNLKSVEKYICFDAAREDMALFDALLEPHSSEEPRVSLSEESCASIVYTSGTTGIPKGVMLSHRNHLADTRNTVIEISLKPMDRALNLLPFYHTGGICIMLRHMYVGNTQVLMKAFDPKKTLETLEKEKISIVFLVPTMLTVVLQVPNIEQYDLSNLRMVLYGAASMPVELLKKAFDIFECEFLQIFGQTEGGPCMTILRPEDHHVEGPPNQVKKLGSAGRSIINFEVKVVHESGKEVKPGEVGEIIGRGDNVMMGYWNRPDETAETIKRGWLYTGDLATVDEEGFIYIVDRRKDMISSGGQNIYPREIEELLYTHPAVLEAAVIGVPHSYWGETVKAIVSLKKGIKVTKEEIIHFCKENLASYKKPTSVEFMDSLPKSAQGKILKNVLREMFLKN